jgi:hypothetical protein
VLGWGWILLRGEEQSWREQGEGNREVGVKEVGSFECNVGSINLSLHHSFSPTHPPLQVNTLFFVSDLAVGLSVPLNSGHMVKVGADIVICMQESTVLESNPQAKVQRNEAGL